MVFSKLHSKLHYLLYDKLTYVTYKRKLGGTLLKKLKCAM